MMPYPTRRRLVDGPPTRHDGGVTTADAPRWRRLGPDQRREQILDCAVRLFGERPYAAVSTTEIAHAAGVARGLLNHYFGTKRDLYLEVVRCMVLLPEVAEVLPPGGTLRERVETSVSWFLDTIAAHGPTFVAVTGAEGVGADPEVEGILAAADDAAAEKVLEAIGLPARERRAEHIAVIRAYGGMVKAAVREWVERDALTRGQVHTLLSNALLAIVRDVLPHVEERVPR
jgi:AcrR family transcriptional regulator